MPHRCSLVSSLSWALVGSLTWLGGCFEDAPIDETGATTTTGSATSGSGSGGADETTATSGADTTGGGPIEVCGACQDTQCTAYAEACAGDPGCANCLAAPYSLGCLADPIFHALANCSCEECAVECGHLCPGGQGACNSCGIAECPALGEACIADPNCAPCLEDAYAEGCADNPAWVAARDCACMACGQECIWQCPAAGNACAGCISTSCTMPFDACIQDSACADCFEAPFSEGCADNDLYAAVDVCTCGMCSPECGVLFNCGD